MNARVKLICLLVLLATGLGFWVYCQTGTAQANVPLAPLAVCDVHRTFRQYKKTIELRAALGADRDTIQAEANTANRQLKEMQEALAASGLLPGSPDFERRRAEVLKKIIETKNFADLSQNELRRRDIQITDTGYQEVYKAVQKVALRKNLTLVLAKENLTLPGQSFEDLMAKIYYRRHVIFADDAIDITAEVIEQLNTDYELR